MIKLYFDDNIPNYILEIIKDYIFELSSFEKCDFIISCRLNENTNNKVSTIQKIISSYENINKKIIIFLISDIPDTFYIPYNVLLFRTSLFRSKKQLNEFILPYIWENINDEIEPLRKTEYPIIGFCGKVNKHRVNLINSIENNKNLISNFIKRNKFWGGDPHNKNLINDFINNMKSSHFIVCNRGNGNYSMRFYQTLSCGRIPILIDTDIILPFNDEINWHEIIIISQTEDDIINNILHWWNTKDIIEIQKKCKNIYNEYFSRKNFLNLIFRYIYNEHKIINTYLFPLDFDPDIYGKYNDISNFNFHNMIKHYIENGKIENRLYKLPYNFSTIKYRKYNTDLEGLNYNQLISHYINYGINENRNI